MEKKNNNYTLYCLAVIIIFFVGCSPQSTHRTLTFFFDGVDDSVSKTTIVTNDTGLNKNTSISGNAAKKNIPELFTHQPYKERKCEKCHTSDKRLLMSLPELCYQCHKDFKETYAYVHGPVASGSCTKCHHQHTASYAKLLIRPGQQLCTYCHKPSLLFKNKFHRDIEDADCTLCHNPHGGTNRHMIKEHIVKKFKGLDEIGSRHLSGRIYNLVPGDINSSGLEVIILNNEGELVSSAFTDINGNFAIRNLHPDNNYYFRFNRKLPDVKIDIINNKNEVLYVIGKNKDNKFLFDKAAYETAHPALNGAGKNDK